MAQLNESDSVSQLPHSQQLLSVPTSLRPKASRDETMNTEMEYVNFMKDANFRASGFYQDESFFRSIIKQDKGETGLTVTDEKASENQALVETNEKLMKEMQELKKQVSELEEENNALEQEHLVMLKKQE